MKLFLIDAYALIYRSYYAFIKNPRINSKGVNTSAIFGFINSLEDVLKRENPTHIAVAIRYDAEIENAPTVVAKGEDYLAAKIKETAKENGVEIMENKPLARALYATVEVGEQIPPELYQAVAEILALVYSKR